MTQLGYRPNSAARALKSGHFKTIGVIMFTLATTGDMRTLEAITDAALTGGYAITLLPPVHPLSPHSSAEVRSLESASRSWTRSSSSWRSMRWPCQTWFCLAACPSLWLTPGQVTSTRSWIPIR